MIWVSPYEAPSKGKDILLNKRHQLIAVKVVRYAKSFKIGKLIWCWSIFLFRIFSFGQDKTKFLKGIGELARLDFTLLKFGVPILCRECGQKRAVGMFLLKLLYFLTFPEWGCGYQKARSNAMRFAVFGFYGDCHLSSKPQFHTIFEKLALIPCFECLNEKLDK